VHPNIADGRMEIGEVGIDPRAADGIGLRPNVSVHFLEREGILFDATVQRVYAANTSATFIWCCLEEGLAPLQIVHRLQAVFSITHEAAAAYFDAAVENWRDLGLISGAADAEFSPDQPEDELESAGEPTTLNVEVVAERLYRLLDVTFRFGFSSQGLADESDAILAPLVAAETPQRCIRLDVIPHEAGYMVIKDGREFRCCPRQDQIVPLLKTCMVELALRESGDFAAVHAAAVGKEERCILLPGVSGSGKSTLTAALVASGLRLLGDDTVVLDSESLAARPVPFAICVKDGAWQLLTSRFPGLLDQPVHNRLDGKHVRYLVGTDLASWATPGSRFEVRGIAFIRRVSEARGALVPISRSEALSRLTTEFCLLADKLDTRKIAELVGWIGKLDCYELQYSNLEDGVALVKSLLA
jgi:hypothetical protein